MHYEIVSILDSLLGHHKEFGRNEHYYFCPFCHHYKPKLAVNMGNRRWHCWKCNASGRSILSLVRRLDVPQDVRNKLARLLEDEIPIATTVDTTPPDLSLPDEYEQIKPGSTAMEYLNSRGITKDVIERYNLGYCSKGIYFQRIIVPSYDANQKLNYFVARSVRHDMRSYTNPPISKNVIAFENHIDWRYPIVLVEGVFDAMAVRRNAIPLLGKTISKKLREKIASENIQHIYLALDSDAMRYTLRHAEKFMNEGRTVYVVKLDGKDPSDIGFVHMQQLIRDAQPLTFGDLIKLKLSLS